MTLGDKGVHVETGSLHGELGDLIVGENVSFLRDGKRGGIHKRMSLDVLTTSAMDGAVLAIYPVTFADPSPGDVLTDDALAVLTDDAFAILTE